MNDQFFERIQRLLPDLSICRQEPLANHTTFRIGGPADLFAEITKVDELATLIRLCKEENVPWFVIGRGSNLLVSDAGYRGLMLHLGTGFAKAEIQDGIVSADSGIMLSTLASQILKQSLAGFEFAAGIPGSLGGAVYMNAGAYGGEMKDILLDVTVLRPDGSIEVIGREDLGLGYRTSRFQTEEAVILRARMQLQPGDPKEIAAKMQNLMERRITKQPLEWPSAGSVFKRPEGHFAGGLIEQAGLKGCRIGGAEVSEKHAGFIINAGGATAADVTALIRHVQQVVLETSGVHLEPEMRILKDEQLMQL